MKKLSIFIILCILGSATVAFADGIMEQGPYGNTWIYTDDDTGSKTVIIKEPGEIAPTYRWKNDRGTGTIWQEPSIVTPTWRVEQD